MISYQFNKTSLGELDKQLKMRLRALPTIKSKESALRVEVTKAKDAAVKLEQMYQKGIAAIGDMEQLWGEFDTSIVQVKDVELVITKIAGVAVPTLRDVKYEIKDYNIFSSPMWTMGGVEILKQLARVGVELQVFKRRQYLLEYARKKTTQKVNLYEKVQIPSYQEAIKKIKRFLEDEENLSKAAQKIVKMRIELAQN